MIATIETSSVISGSEFGFGVLPSDSHQSQLDYSLTAETIVSVAYGIQIQKENDPYVKISEDANAGAVIAAIPGRFLVDAIPLLKYVPAWFPGAYFKRQAREWYRQTRMMVEIPYADAKKRIVRITRLSPPPNWESVRLPSPFCRSPGIPPIQFY